MVNILLSFKRVGDSVVKLIKDIFTQGRIPDGLNKKLICLVPKISRPENDNHLRPVLLPEVLLGSERHRHLERSKTPKSQTDGIVSTTIAEGRTRAVSCSNRKAQKQWN